MIEEKEKNKIAYQTTDKPPEVILIKCLLCQSLSIKKIAHEKYECGDCGGISYASYEAYCMD